MIQATLFPEQEVNGELRPVRHLPHLDDEYREQPHWCAVCGVLLDPYAVREGNDGSVLCPRHIGTLA